MELLPGMWEKVGVEMSDLISRDKLLSTIRPMAGMWEDETFWINYERVLEIIESAEPEERTEKIHDDKIHPVIHYCGNDTFTLINPTWDYCPHCGTKLEWV